MKIKLKTRDILLYLFLIPFLHPRGFDEYFGWYKNFFTIWMYLAMAIGIFYFVYSVFGLRMRYPKCILAMMLYFGLMAIITLCKMGSFNGGLQKIFAAPVLCMLCAFFAETNGERLIEVLENILFVVFGLNIIVFNPGLFNHYFSARDEQLRLLFIGHVQIAAQLGLLGLYVACLSSNIKGKAMFRSKLLIVFSAFTMLMSFTSASMIVLVILFIGGLYIRLSRTGKLLKHDSRFYVVGYFLLDAILMLYLYTNGWLFQLFGLNINGRGYIWEQVYNKFSESPWVGYGVKGVLVKVFWSIWVGDGQGMNYTHNQIFQVLLDGGIILFLSFGLFLFTFTKCMKKNLEDKTLKFSNVCLIGMLFVMIFESVFEYHYVILLFSLFAFCTGKRIYRKREVQHGNL